jgi:hypothetical protein
MIFSISTKSRAQELGQGNAIFSLGHGFVAPANAAFRGLAEGLASDTVLGADALGFRNLGPYYLKGEYMVSDNSGLGLNLAYISNRATWSDEIAGYEYSASRSNLSVMVRYNYYLQTRENFELYGGLGVGMRIGGWKLASEDPTFVDIPSTVAVPLALETTLGFRAYPIDNLAIYGEIGLSKAIAQIGIAYRL